jgi:hypothetical protein
MLKQLETSDSKDVVEVVELESALEKVNPGDARCEQMESSECNGPHAQHI